MRGHRPMNISHHIHRSVMSVEEDEEVEVLTCLVSKHDSTACGVHVVG